MKIFRWNKYQEIKALLVLILLLVSYLIYLHISNFNIPSPKAFAGELNLANWDFEKSGPIKLRGEWEYFPSEILNYSEITQVKNRKENFYKVPGVWTEDIWSLSPTVGNGFGTFMLTIELPNSINQMSIYSREQATAYKFLLNDLELGGAGTIGKSEDSSIPMTIPGTFFIQTDSKIIHVVLQVSNFHHRKGGVRRDIYFGNQKDILKFKTGNLNNDTFFIGLLTCFIIYHLSIYFLRRKETSYLIFSLFCFDILLRILTTGEVLIQTIFPLINYSGMVRLEYISLYMGLPLGLHFIKHLYTDDFPDLLLFTSYCVSFLFSLTLVLSVKYFSIFIPIFQILMILGMIVSFLYLAIAVQRKKRFRFLIAIGFIPLIVLAINDILYSNDIINTGYFVQYGFILLLFSESLILSSKFAYTMNLNEELRKNLEKKVILRTNQLNQEMIEKKLLNLNLQESMKQISKDLELAKKAQTKILPNKSDTIGSFQYYYDYIPLRTVGGDFLSISKIENKKIRYMICDITGHGIQAALITFIIKSEYEAISHRCEEPNQIIDEFNAILLTKYKNLQMNFPCFVIDFFIEEDFLRYSSAGFPEQFIAYSNSIKPLRPTSPILGMPKINEFVNRDLPFKKGDKFISFSDGIIESQNYALEFFGNLGYAQMILDIIHSNDLENSVRIILEKENQFRDDQLRKDDITLFILQKLESMTMKETP